MFVQPCQPLFGLFTSGVTRTIELYIRADKRSDEPGPNRALVVSAVTARAITGIAGAILRIAGGKTAEPVRREQMLLHRSNNLLCAIRGQHRMRQADGKDLIRTNTRVRRAAVDHVI